MAADSISSILYQILVHYTLEHLLLQCFHPIRGGIIVHGHPPPWTHLPGCQQWSSIGNRMLWNPRLQSGDKDWVKHISMDATSGELRNGLQFAACEILGCSKHHRIKQESCCAHLGKPGIPCPVLLVILFAQSQSSTSSKKHVVQPSSSVCGCESPSLEIRIDIKPLNPRRHGVPKEGSIQPHQAPSVPPHRDKMSSTLPSTITDEARARAPISSAAVVGVGVVCLILPTVFTGTRVYTRFTVYQQFWWDDCKSDRWLA